MSSWSSATAASVKVPLCLPPLTELADRSIRSANTAASALSADGLEIPQLVQQSDPKPLEMETEARKPARPRPGSPRHKELGFP